MNRMDEFYRLKPQLNGVQHDLLNAFYMAKKDCQVESLIPTKILKEHLELIEYEIDWGVWILRKLDEYFIELRSEKIEADRQAAKEAKEKNSNVR